MKQSKWYKKGEKFFLKNPTTNNAGDFSPFPWYEVDLLDSAWQDTKENLANCDFLEGYEAAQKNFYQEKYRITDFKNELEILIKKYNITDFESNMEFGEGEQKLFKNIFWSKGSGYLED